MPDPWEAPEVAIVGHEVRAMLECQRGQMSVGCQIAGRSGVAKQATEQGCVPRLASILTSP